MLGVGEHVDGGDGGEGEGVPQELVRHRPRQVDEVGLRLLRVAGHVQHLRHLYCRLCSIGLHSSGSKDPLHAANGPDDLAVQARSRRVQNPDDLKDPVPSSLREQGPRVEGTGVSMRSFGR